MHQSQRLRPTSPVEQEKCELKNRDKYGPGLGEMETDILFGKPRRSARLAERKLGALRRPAMFTERDFNVIESGSEEDHNKRMSEDSEESVLVIDESKEEDDDDDGDKEELGEKQRIYSLRKQRHIKKYFPEAVEGSQLEFLENNLSELPFGAQRRARNLLGDAPELEETLSPPHSNSYVSESVDPEIDSAKQPMKRERESERRRQPVAKVKRVNKHAPMEITSKKLVSRKRIILESATPRARDPRFLSLTGQFSLDHYRRSYSFLFEARKRELGELRASLARARKELGRTSRRDEKNFGERAAEVAGLERAVKRGESAVHLDEKERVEREALRRVKAEERKKRKQGKKEWYMKKAKKKEILERALRGALEKEKGKAGVKKAMVKKQRKLGQKEKRSRPFSREAARATLIPSASS